MFAFSLYQNCIIYVSMKKICSFDIEFYKNNKVNRVQEILGSIKRYLSKMDLKVYLVCVLIATFIWLMMKLSDEYSKEIDIPIHYTNYPEGMILVNKPVASLKVQVESQGFQMMTVALRNNKQVRIDLSKIELRRTRYKRWVASIPSRYFSSDISTQLGVDPIGSRIKPDSIFFVFDSLITKEFPIKINSKISFVEGNTLWGDLIIEPKKVQVTGPALTVKSLKSISADSLILEHVSEGFSRVLKLKNPNKYLKLNPSNVKVSAKVTKFSEFSSEVPLIIESSVPGLKVKTFPSRVKIIYSIPIPEYGNISDSSFVVVVHIDSLDILKGNHLIPKIMRKPSFVRAAYLNVDKVEFIMLKK